MLSGSLQTLTSLILPAFAFGDHEHPHLIHVHFPSLRALEVRGCNGKVQTWPTIGTRITNFIVSHDTIEELCLTTPIQLDAAQLNANSLPRIRVFKGYLSVFNMMMLAQLTSLSTTLRDLALTFRNPNDGEINRMLSIVRSSRCRATLVPSCLSMLQEIKFTTCSMWVPVLEQIIGGCAKLFGSTLNVLKVSMDQKHLQSGLVSKLALLFEPFEKLRIVSFTVTNGIVGFPEGLSSEERAQNLRFALPFAWRLFQQCITLREVRMKMSTLEHAWLVTRTPNRRSKHCPNDNCTGHLIYVPIRLLRTKGDTTDL